jgi:hypothetical protein
MAAIFGSILLLVTLRDVFQTVIVPRGNASKLLIAPFFVRCIFWPIFGFAASKIRPPKWKAEILANFAPLVVIVLLTTWMCAIIVAFALIFYTYSDDFTPRLTSIFDSLYISGSTVLTLGCPGAVNSDGVKFLTLAAPFVGMIVMASVVSLLFTLVGSIQRREVLVAAVSNIAGSPPSGIAILESYFQMNGTDRLGNFFQDWDTWCADVLESHSAYSILPYFRSKDPENSWITTLGAVLDSASLLLAVHSKTECLSAKVAYQFACKLVHDIKDALTLKSEHQSDLSDEDFHKLYERLKEANYCTLDEANARENFKRLRQEYYPALQALARFYVVPITPLFSKHQLRLPELIG